MPRIETAKVNPRERGCDDLSLAAGPGTIIQRLVISLSEIILQYSEIDAEMEILELCPGEVTHGRPASASS